MTYTSFLSLTFAISLAGFACILLVPGARSPESVVGLPFWLIMVWGPSLAAILLSLRDGRLMELISRTAMVSTIPLSAWVLVLAPIALLLLLRPFAPDAGTHISLGALALMIAFNLILGPFGEELGWRGVFQEKLNRDLGWLEASLLIGAIWFAWHLPLWTFDSPHSQIALPLFAGHVMCYAVIIGAAYSLSGGSILPAILIHLAVNVASNLAVFAGFREPNAWFSSSLGPYFLLAVVAIALVCFKTGQLGLKVVAGFDA